MSLLASYNVTATTAYVSFFNCKFDFITAEIVIRYGPSIKDVRRDGGRGVGQMRTPANRGREVKALADVRKLVLF